MSISSNYLSVQTALCSTCNRALPITGDYIKCFNCGSKYHYSPCGTLSESTYSVMTMEKKTSWRCVKCRNDKSRSKSPNNLYQEVTYDEPQQQEQQQQPQTQHEQPTKKQQRSDDGNEMEATDSSKRFKDSIFLNNINSNVTDLKSDVLSFKSTVSNEFNDIKASINLMNSNMSNAFLKLTEAMSTLTAQVNDLKKENMERDIRLERMESKVNILEQQLINKNIEIKNVHDNNITPIDAIKTIAASVHVDVQDSDINNAYKVKKNENIIVEFCSLNKKRELMSKLRGHKVNGDLFTNTFGKPNSRNNEINHPTNQTFNNIFINDQLTANNRRLLWQAKTKAKESGWKFVWVRNGNIFAKKSETSSVILIHNSSDIELIA